MLALWLPATSHCSLESVWDVFSCHDETPLTVAGDSCRQDSCEVVENGAYLKGVADLRLAPAELVLPLCWAMLLSVPEERVLAVLGGSLEEPEVWHLNRTWVFVRRAALPARAPSRVA